MLAHFGCFAAAWFFLGIVAPMITYVVRGDRPFVRQHSQQSINLNLTTYLLMGVAAIGAVIAVARLASPSLLPMVTTTSVSGSTATPKRRP